MQEKEKAEKKALAEQDKTEKKALEQNKKRAQSLLTKMETGLQALTSTLEQPESLMLREHVRLTGEAALAELKDIQKRCRCVIQDPSRDDELMELKELTAKLGHAKRIDSLMTGIYRGGN